MRSRCERRRWSRCTSPIRRHGRSSAICQSWRGSPTGRSPDSGSAPISWPCARSPRCLAVTADRPPRYDAVVREGRPREILLRIGMSLNYAGGFAETVAELADYEKAGLDIVFVPEAYSYDAVSQLGFIAAK